MEPARRDDGGTNNATKSTSVTVIVCYKCSNVPAAGNELLSCANCFSVRYCSAICQKSDWSDHKLTCEASRTIRARSAAHSARIGSGSARSGDIWKNIKFKEWFCTVPGLIDNVQFLAWKHRLENPDIVVRCEDAIRCRL